MIFRKIEENNGWNTIAYTTTWGYGYDFMIDAVQAMIDVDFKENLDRVAYAEMPGRPEAIVTDAVKKAGGILRDVNEVVEERGMLTVAGRSNVMGVPIQFTLFNQTSVVQVFVPSSYIDEHGERVLDNYMNSIEIKAYCMDTERQVTRKFKNV